GYIRKSICCVQKLEKFVLSEYTQCGGSNFDNRQNKEPHTKVILIVVRSRKEGAIQDVRAAKDRLSRSDKCAKQDTARHDTTRGYSSKSLHGQILPQGC